MRKVTRVIVKHKTDYVAHKYQKEIHKNLKRFSVLVCHRRFGKTYLAINTLIDAAVRTNQVWLCSSVSETSQASSLGLPETIHIKHTRHKSE